MLHNLKDLLQYANALPITTVERVERQRIELSGAATSGSFKLVYGAIESAEIAYNAGADEIQTALRNIAGLESVIVSQIEAGLFEVLFEGVDGDVDPLTVTDNTLSSGGGDVDVWINTANEDSGGLTFYDPNAYDASEFIPTATGSVTGIVVKQMKEGSPDFDIVLEIWSSTAGLAGEREPDALLGTSDPVDVSTLSVAPTYADKAYSFSTPVPVVSGTSYWVVFRAINIVTLNGSNLANTKLVDTANNPETSTKYSEDAGVTWSEADSQSEVKMTITASTGSAINVDVTESAKGVGSGTIYSNAVDLSDFQGCALLVHSSAYAFDGSHKATIKLQESENGSSWTAVAAEDLYESPESDTVVKTLDASGDAETLHVINYKGGKRYIRAQIDLEGVLEEAGESSLKFSCIAIKGFPMIRSPLRQVV